MSNTLKMSSIWNFSSGPQLFYRYKHGSTAGKAYVENSMESYSSKTIGALRASWSMCYMFSPIILIVLHRRGLFTSPDGPPYLAKVVTVALAVYYFAHLTRGFGRMSNKAYQHFEAELRQVKNGQLPKLAITRYDFSFSHWPVDYSVKNNRSRPLLTPPSDKDKPAAGIFSSLIGYLASRTFARWLLYPGSTSLLNSMIEPALMEGRTKLVQNHSGKRNKLETYEGNHIDTMFIDRRHEGTENGNILVITSEGNAAFYEAGCMEAPLSRGYSILGWNHPGFGSSTGKPHPEQEHNAMDCVVQFALEKLNFPIEQIVFMSWSIGGFSSSWAAANYPECKAVVLDATFDDVMPLARNRMPKWMDGLVETTIREYFDLNNAKWLNMYNGPVKLIRRTQDEMIALNPVDIRTNRGNDLLLKLLSRRYPHIVNEEAQNKIITWLSLTDASKEEYLTAEGVEAEDCHSALTKLSELGGNGIPLLAGEELDQTRKNTLALYLADKHMVDVTSTHCVPLPAAMFELPWQLHGDDD